MRYLLSLTFIFLLAMTGTAVADQAGKLLDEYRKAAGVEAFDPEEGRRLWYRNNEGRSCTSCHGDSPADTGRHVRTGKTIEPMAPAVNGERLTDKREMKKWFLRNCKWTMGRECTPREKGDILTWLLQQ